MGLTLYGGVILGNQNEPLVLRVGRIVGGIGENSLTQLRYNMVTLWEF